MTFRLRVRPTSRSTLSSWTLAVPTGSRGSIRLSRDVIDHFKSGGPGWQARIDDALRKIAKG